jgi:hypothetical protein
MTVSNGSTLGTASGILAKLAVLAIDNAGTVELAVVNANAYGLLDERSLISTTAEGGTGTADSGTVIYSTTARTSVPFRIVGYVESTQATAGAWATSPSNIAGMGGAILPQPTPTINSGTAVASTSGTSIDFSIPSWVKRITVMLSGVSTNGTSNIEVQLGDAGGVETTGYSGAMTRTGASALATSQYSTTGFLLVNDLLASDLFSGNIVFTYIGSNIFTGVSQIAEHASPACFLGSGTKTLSATLTQVRITTVNGTDTFDAGTINILYE